MTTTIQALTAPPKRISADQMKAMQVSKPKALEVMASRVNVEPAKLLNTLRETVFKGASEEELIALVLVANQYDLNPFLREIYAFKGLSGGIVPVIPIDGWIKIVNRQPNFEGVEFEYLDDEEGKPYLCTCSIFISGRNRPVKIPEYFRECYRKTDPWDMMPRRMLRHKALIQCARVAFGFSGAVDEDEAIDIQSHVIEEPPIKPQNQITLPTQEKDEPKPKKEETVHADLAALLTENGFNSTQLFRWCAQENWFHNADSCGTIEEIPLEAAKRLIRAKTGLIAGLKSMFSNEGGSNV